MSDELKILSEIHELLTQQIAAAQKELTPDEIARYEERSRRIRQLAERLRENHPGER